MKMNKYCKNYFIFFIILVFSLSISLISAMAQEPGAAEGAQGVKLITIPEGIKMVLKNNRLIKVAMPGNEMALQDSLVARSALLPHLNAFAEKTFAKYAPAVKFGSTAIETADRNPFTYGFDVYQTLFDFGKSLSYYKSSKEAYKAQLAHTESIKRLATLEFIVAYFDLLETERLILVFEKEVASLESYLSDIQHLYEHGAAVKNDLLPAKVRLADVKQRLIAAYNRKETAKARLNNILGLELTDNIEGEDLAMDSPQFPEMTEAWKTAQAQRQEIIFYQDQINASTAAQRAKAAENLPTFYADTGYNYQQNKYAVHEDNASVNLGAKWNLYDGGAARAELLKERARTKQLKEQKDKLVEDIKFEVEDSFYSLKDACEKKDVAKDALEEADENVRFWRVKYNAGSATPTDVLEAISMQTKADVNYCTSDYELKRSYAKLMYSMGIDLGLVYEKMENKENGEHTERQEK